MSQDASGGGPCEHRVKVPTRPVAPLIYRLALLGVVLVLVVIAYYPFGWDPPRYVTNGVTRSTDGYLRFAEMNNARTQGTPAWLPSVRRFWCRRRSSGVPAALGRRERTHHDAGQQFLAH